jgi:ferrous-iron efflux pump FieF
MMIGIKQKASLVAITSATILAVCKFAVGLSSGSMAVMSSGLDSMLDVFMSFMNFLAIKKADDPPDRNHHYGHGKVEDIAAIIQSLVIMFTGSVIIYSAVLKFIRKDLIQYSIYDTGVMVLSLLFSYFISRELNRVGEKTGSNTLKADALHYSSDLYSNSAALAAIIITYFTGMDFFDLSFAIVIGVFIIFSATKILKAGILGLTDASVPEEVKNQIELIIDKMELPYAGYHKLRTRMAGSKKYTDFHMLICRRASVDEAHSMADAVEKEIIEKIKSIDVLIHIEPCPYTCEMNDETCRILKIRAATQRHA